MSNKASCGRSSEPASSVVCALTPSGEGYAYTYLRDLSTLYVLTGVD